MKTRFDMTGRIDGVRRTPQGGIIASATLTRVGVFTYQNADGSKIHELRHPDDIFKEDSLASLHHAPVTIGHPGMVTPANYRTHAVGNVSTDVRADGKHVRATVLIQDADAVARVELGAIKPNDPNALVEFSLGYETDVIAEEGEFEGERYDARQTGHRYNHAALGPANWGRAGNSVRLTLDSAGNAVADSYISDMTIAVRTDDTASDAKARLDAVSGERDALKSTLESVRSELALTKEKLDSVSTELVGANALNAKLIDPSKIGEMVAARVQLESSARAVLGAKYDAKNVSDRDVMLAALAKHDPKFDAKDRSDEYIRARFDAACEHASSSDASVAELAKASTPAAEIKADASASGGKSALDIANENAAKRLEAASKAGAPAGAMTRK